MSKRARSLALALPSIALAYLVSLAPVAHAQSKLVDPYIAAKIRLGLGGTLTTSQKQGSTTVSQDQDLEVSFGVAGQYLHPLHDYFALGGMFGLESWRSTAGGNGGRNLLFDLAALPQGKYVIIPDTLEVNFSIPLGLALDVLNEADASNASFRFATGGSAGSSVKGDTALGFVVGALLGARWQVLDKFGLLAELGYMYRTFGHTVTTSVTGPLAAVSSKADVNVSFGQFALNLGAYF